MPTSEIPSARTTGWCARGAPDSNQLSEGELSGWAIDVEKRGRYPRSGCPNHAPRKLHALQHSYVFSCKAGVAWSLAGKATRTLLCRFVSVEPTQRGIMSATLRALKKGPTRGDRPYASRTLGEICIVCGRCTGELVHTYSPLKEGHRRSIFGVNGGRPRCPSPPYKYRIYIVHDEILFGRALQNIPTWEQPVLQARPATGSCQAASHGPRRSFSREWSSPCASRSVSAALVKMSDILFRRTTGNGSRQQQQYNINSMCEESWFSWGGVQRSCLSLENSVFVNAVCVSQTRHPNQSTRRGAVDLGMRVPQEDLQTPQNTFRFLITPVSIILIIVFSNGYPSAIKSPREASIYIPPSASTAVLDLDNIWHIPWVPSTIPACQELRQTSETGADPIHCHWLWLALRRDNSASASRKTSFCVYYILHVIGVLRLFPSPVGGGG